MNARDPRAPIDEPYVSLDARARDRTRAPARPRRTGLQGILQSAALASAISISGALTSIVRSGSSAAAAPRPTVPTGVSRPMPSSVATAPAEERPNLLLITMDTTRADHLGCYGNTEASTPTLDRLAREGLRVERAIAVAPLTLPSHASILTGLYPPSHGVHDNGDYRLPDAALTLAERLTARGYATGAAVGSVVLDRSRGLSQGFASYDQPEGRTRAPHEGGAVGYPDILERKGSAVTDAALRSLARTGRRPFFIWAHYFDPHADYTPPEPFARRFVGRPYDGEIAYMDAQISRLLEALRMSGRLDRTLVVVTADHGESLGEHGEQTHGLLLYDATLRVPLMLRYPRSIAPGSTLSGRLVSSVDILPTILDLLGLDAMPGVQGTSFAAQIPAPTGKPSPRDGSAAAGSRGDRSKAAGEPGDRHETPRDDRKASDPGAAPAASAPAAAASVYGAVYSETWLPYRSYGWSPLTSLRDGSTAFIDAPAPELYDTLSDPGESHDLAPAQPQRAASWRERLTAWLGTLTPPAGDPGLALDAEQRERLSSLGYLSSGGTRTGDPRREGKSLADPKRMVRLHEELLDAKALIARRRTAEAKSRIDDVLRADPANPAALTLSGMLAFSEGDRTTGLERLQSAARQHPDVYENQRNLANALHELGRLAEAEKAYRASLALHPESAEDHYALGNVLAARKDYRSAIGEYERAIGLAPPPAGLYAALGAAQRSAGEARAAERALRKAVEMDPKLGPAWTLLGRIAEDAGRLAEARARYEKALALQPDAPEALLHHALVCLRLGVRSAADTSAREYLGRHGGDTSAIYLRAEQARSEGRLADAKRLLAQFIARPDADASLVEMAKRRLSAPK